MEFLGSILTGVVALVAVILALVGVLMFAERRLVQSGKVKILINGDASKSPEVDAGGTLLSVLSSQGVFLPSACGGGGTCAMCKCQVLEGGGDILPTELTHITRGEAKENWRLACQVKVKQDMKIKVPDEVFSIKKWECTVRSNDNVATFIKELVVDLPEGEILHFESGGYIQIDVPAYKGIQFKDFQVADKFREDWDKYNIWQYVANNDEPCFRAYSMANHPAEGNMVMLNIRIATPPPRTEGIPPGICSSYVFSLEAGDKITISGPYGEFFIKETENEMIYIGGGAGMAPLRSHIFHLFHTLRTGRKVSYWYGARSLRELFYEDHFRAIEKEFPNFSFHVALSEPMPEDNWTGPVGFIHQVVHNNYLKDHPNADEIEYYLCGPPMMLSAVQNMLYDLGVEKEQIAFDDFGS
ncbi:MAG: NADH:ubiquinone reductase (Na(+)-transporting) subunit F [Planctomycetota bacterium]|nr:NADH:ubiquinone reductase (Na(+)-transporting) subunit F [Planctomycetota bacterium]MDA0933670.1 NADH:ubiquinone reductase (Na(+)-transporting) subunit F [Planctomycetota bacterium]MDA1221769.1 NADH:ubiquinone reductase (Na(+)-transporting) subunit F [Planctomycetota bacterium]